MPGRAQSSRRGAHSARPGVRMLRKLTAALPTISIRPRGGRSDGGHRPLWLTAPAALLMVGAFLLPLVVLTIESFLTDQSFTRAGPPFTLSNYHAVISDPAFGTALVSTVTVGLLTATVTTILGLTLAYWLRYRAGRLGTVVLVLVIITMFASYLVRIYAWRSMLGGQGVIVAALRALGLTHGQGAFLLFSRTAVVIAETQLYLPVIILILHGGFRPLAPAYLEVSRDLGAGPIERWRRVILPLMARPLMTAFLLGFLFSSADWVAPSFLGGSQLVMLGMTIQSDFSTTLDWAQGAAICLVMAVGYVALYMLAASGLRALKLDKLQWTS
jgi:spermidine/putrescine transport system permease protein